MIIPKVKKLIQFLKNRPLVAINSQIDIFSIFLLKQATYAYFITFGLVCISVLQVIVPLKGNEYGNTLPAMQKAVNNKALKRADQRSSRFAIGIKPRLASTSTSSRMKKVASKFVPTEEQIKNFPLALVVSYKLSSPQEGLTFRLALKSYMRYGELEVSKENGAGVSYGLGLDCYGTLVKPMMPILRSTTFGARVSHVMRNIRDYLLEHYHEDSSNILPYSILEEGGVNLSSGTTSPSISEPVLVRASARDNVRRSSSPRATVFARFKRHFFYSIYARFDYLKTFILKLEQ